MLYQITDEALEDLDEIDDFIVDRLGKPENAEVVRAYLRQAFERLGRDPAHCGGRAWPEVTNLPVKFMTVRKYVVV